MIKFNDILQEAGIRIIPLPEFEINSIYDIPINFWVKNFKSKSGNDFTPSGEKYRNESMKRKIYNEAVKVFDSLPDPIPIYRAIVVDKSKQLKIEEPGLSWTWNKNFAFQWADKKIMDVNEEIIYILCATIKKSNVDWLLTLERFAQYTTDSSNERNNELKEYEIKLKSNNKNLVDNLKIEQYEYDTNYSVYPKGSKPEVHINDGYNGQRLVLVGTK